MLSKLAILVGRSKLLIEDMQGKYFLKYIPTGYFKTLLMQSIITANVKKARDTSK